MNANNSVKDEFSKFIEWMKKDRHEALDQLSKIQNGFENWIKIEFYLWLINVRENRLKPQDKDDYNQVGLEYRVKLNSNNRKRCDMWFGTESSGYHYIELKNIFNNSNKQKMMKSVIGDLECMVDINHRDESPVSGNAIILGVGFDDYDGHKWWVDSIEKVIVKNKKVNCYDITSDLPLQVAVFSYSYANGT